MNTSIGNQIAISYRHLLSEVNRDPSADTYGCFDRRYWAWKMADFPEATFQRNVSALAWFMQSDLSVVFSQTGPEIIKAALAFTFKIQHRDGSFDQAYPQEHSFGATGFLLPDLLSAYTKIKPDCTPQESLLFESGLRKAAIFLEKNSEQHSLISNHLAGAALGLFGAGELFQEKKFTAKAEELLASILNGQSREGWFPEYGGADPGYQTLCMHYLAQIYRMHPSGFLHAALEKSLAFLKYFAHPDGTFGGEYGSRRTEVYYPGGIALLADEFLDAKVLNNFMHSSIETGRTVTLADIDMGNTAPLLNSYIMAYGSAAARDARLTIPFQQTNLDMDFHEAGICVRAREKYYLIVGASNGGVVKIFDKACGKLVVDDCGIFGLTENKMKITTQSTHLDNSLRISDNEIECDSQFYPIKDTIPSPFNYLILRLLNLTVMRVNFINELIKKVMVSVLVENKKTISIRRKRIVTVNSDSIRISDMINNKSHLLIKKMIQGFKFTAIHMASARYFTPAQEKISKIRLIDCDSFNIKGTTTADYFVEFPEGVSERGKRDSNQ